MLKKMDFAEVTRSNYSLKWGDFQSDFTSGFHNLLKEETMCDVTLAVEGDVIHAHKVVLSVCSPYFQHLFKANPCKHPIVFLKDVSRHIVSYVIDFMYKGEANIDADDLQSFLQLAEAFKIKGLAEELQKKDSFGSRKRLASVSSVSTLCDDKLNDFGKEDRRMSHRKYSKRKKSLVANAKDAESAKSTVVTAEIERLINNSDSDSRPLVSRMKRRPPGGAKRRKTATLSRRPDERTSGSDDLAATEADKNVLNIEYCSENSLELIDQIGHQGGVDYQMIQTKRGRDMLLYDGFTFTQNRMCKDGMRWQCSYTRCRAFCRMSSAGWLTPINKQHNHDKPPDNDIRRRILRMELKARASSSSATPGEIIRNALPANEFQTTDQRACFTRCIQRYRKSLLRRKAIKTEPNWTEPVTVETMVPEKVSDPEDWLHEEKISKELDKHPLVEGMWSVHPQPVHVTEEEKYRQLNEQKDIVTIETKISTYEL